MRQSLILLLVGFAFIATAQKSKSILFNVESTILQATGQSFATQSTQPLDDLLTKIDAADEIGKSTHWKSYWKAYALLNKSVVQA